MGRPTKKQVRYRNVWRKTIMTEDVIKKLEEAIKIDCTIGQACAYAWINEATYYDHYKKNPQFSKRMDDAEKWLHILASQKWAEWIQKGDKDMIKEYKKKRDKRYADKLEHSGTDWWPIGVIFLPKLGDGWTDSKTDSTPKAIWSSV
jgi:hypothetical protein